MVRVFPFVTLFLLFFSILAPAQSPADFSNRDRVHQWLGQLAEAIQQQDVSADLQGIKAQAVFEEVEMRDGTRLATDIYRPLLPTDDFPAILVRTPYGRKDSTMTLLAAALTGYGYAVVVQDTRGSYDSEGINRAFFDDGWGFYPGLEDHWDGYDTVEWINRRSWSNGKIGMFGISAFGITANYAAGAAAPSLDCFFVVVAASDLYHDAVHQGGGFRKSLVEGWLEDVRAVTEVLEIVREHETYDELWRDASVIGRHPVTAVPGFHMGGWYDIFLQGTLNHFAGLQSNGAAPAARGNQKLLIGPWTHTGYSTTEQGQLNYPENSVRGFFDIAALVQQWFDYWLKDAGKDVMDSGVMDGPPVEYYMMGDVDDNGATRANEWRYAAGWPVAATPRSLYLSQEGRLVGARSSITAGSSAYLYHPENPVPTLGGANLMLPQGPVDLSSIENRADVLVFTTPVLEEPLEITGRLKVVLHGASTAPDTDWTAWLCDVYPDGRSMLVTDGLRRARFRAGFENSVLLQPGRAAIIEIDLWSTALVFNQGHQIRLLLSSSNSPRFEPNPNTGLPGNESDQVQSATNTIFWGESQPSRLVLPVTWPTDHPLFQAAEEPSQPHWSIH
jgi:uncharacterized protein